jgi:hypothetical protein
VCKNHQYKRAIQTLVDVLKGVQHRMEVFPYRRRAFVPGGGDGCEAYRLLLVYIQ